MPQFEHYIGIDYSGAETPTSSLKGLRVYEADRRLNPPVEVSPPHNPRKYWTRKDIAEWLVEKLSEPKPTIVGIDHGFSFPRKYFEMHCLPSDWSAFLDDFQTHWPTDGNDTSVGLVRDGSRGQGAKRKGDLKWLRLTEQWTATAKSVFQFDVPGQVATSTHAGLPWLRFIRQRCGEQVHFWPFDGWEIPTDRSAVAEVYPSLWMRRFQPEKPEERDNDQQAAYATAAWLQRADMDNTLPRFLNPPLTEDEQTQAKVEGWILGVT